MLPQRAAQAYSQIGVETGVAAASPHQLVLMLYDGARQAIVDARAHIGARQAIVDARAHIDAGRTPEKGRSITRAIAIIDEGLKGCLDASGGDIAENLRQLYDYMCRRLLVAGVNNDRAALDEVAALLGELRGAWTAMPSSATAAPATLTAA